MKIYIYGIFIGDICQYVGRSIHPNKRIRAHTVLKGSRFVGGVGRILTTVPFDKGSVEEGKWIHFYKEKGQAIGNKIGDLQDGITQKEQLEIIKKIKSLKPGKPFTVRNSESRIYASRVGKCLKDCGELKFTLVTKRVPDGFLVAAI